jgi:hypothetical protein
VRLFETIFAVYNKHLRSLIKFRESGVANFYNVQIGGETFMFLKGYLTEARRHPGKIYILMSGDEFRVTHQIMNFGDVFEVINKLDFSVKQRVIRNGYFIYDTMGGMNMKEWCAPCVHIVAKKLRFPQNMSMELINFYTNSGGGDEEFWVHENSNVCRRDKDDVMCLDSKIGKCHTFINSKFVNIMKELYGSLSLARGVCMLTPFLANAFEREGKPEGTQHVKNVQISNVPEFVCGKTGRKVSMECGVEKLKSVCCKTKAGISWINDNGVKQRLDVFAVGSAEMGRGRVETDQPCNDTVYVAFLGPRNAIVFGNNLKTEKWTTNNDIHQYFGNKFQDNTPFENKLVQKMVLKLLCGENICDDLVNNVNDLSQNDLALLNSLRRERNRSSMLAMIFFHSI